MEELKTKEFNLLTPFEITKKEADIIDTTSDNIIKIEGWANWYGEYGSVECDLVGDAVCPDGVDVEIWKANPQILIQHDRTRTIGRGLSLEKRPEGLYITAEIHREACDPEDFYRIKSGLMNRLSIGFRCKNGTMKEVDGQDVWFITESQLYEVSVVSLPAAPKSAFRVVKAMPNGAFTSSRELYLENKKEAPTKQEDKLMNITVKRADLLEAADLEKFKALGGNPEEELEVSLSGYIKEQVAREVANVLAAKEAEAKELAEKEAQAIAEKQAEEEAVKAAELEAQKAAEAEANLEKETEEKELADEFATLKELVETLKATIKVDEK